MKKLFKSAKGFTLIELLIVIAILGALAAAMLVAIDPLEQISKSNDARVQADARAIYQWGVNYATENPNTGFPTSANNANYGSLKTPYGGGSYSYFITATGGVNTDLVVCGALHSKQSIAKAGTNTPYFTVTASGNCIKNAVCAAGTTCP